MEVPIDALTQQYLADDRRHHDGGPWVLLNMIASIDGAIAIDGLSGGLGNEADGAVFATLRGLADVILVGAGTARAEGYRVPAPQPAVMARRRAAGQQPRPQIALVTRRLSLDLEGPLFADPTYRPMVVTVASADPERLEATAAAADVVVAGDDEVDLRRAVAELGARVGPVILAEGGPRLNGDLAAADLFDEVCVTVSPTLVGGDGGRMLAGGSEHAARSFAVDRAAAAGGLLFTRYLRRR